VVTRTDPVGGSDCAYLLGWGPDGLAAMAPRCDVVVIVDVLRFTTAVCAGVEAGAEIVPFRWGDPRAAEQAERVGAALAGRRAPGRPSLSPTDLLGSERGARIVLPSPNGSVLAVDAGERSVPFVLAGCFRNAAATARRAAMLAHGSPIGVVAAGERWHAADGPLRPCVEDLLGAGAILHALDPSGSVVAPCCDPEARAARAAFLDARPLLGDVLAASDSGRELVAGGDGDDVATAAEIDVTTLAAQLIDGRFVGV
jgi:2-phosphosulfolactate phosphatase